LIIIAHAAALNPLFKMKVLLRIAVACLLSGAIFSCEKEKKQRVSIEVGLNDTTLNFSTSGRIFGNTISFLFDFIDDQDINRLELHINKLPIQTGTFDIVPFTVHGETPQASLFTMEEDLALDDYRLLEGESNTFSITKLDTLRQKVSGTFDLTFVIDTTFTYKKDGFPDTIRLRSGEFDINYRK
jgi:hypothetical protein